MHIVAIVGLAGAGKTYASNKFREAGYQHIYLPQPVVDELEKRGWPFDEKHSRIVREELRKQQGMDVLAKHALPKIRQLLPNGSIVLESFYSWSSYKTLKREYGEKFIVIAVHATPTTREKRLKNRNIRPHTKEETESRDISQIENIEQSGPIARADHHIINEGTKEELHKQIDAILTILSAQE